MSVVLEDVLEEVDGAIQVAVRRRHKLRWQLVRYIVAVQPYESVNMANTAPFRRDVLR